MAPVEAISSVCPSAGAAATWRVPIRPAAPGRYSVTTGEPQRFCRCTLSTRPRTSVAPPAGNGTMMRTGPAGKFCAYAAGVSANGARVTTNDNHLGTARFSLLLSLSRIIHPREIEPVRRRDRSAGGAVALLERGGNIVGGPLALAHERERADHRAHLRVQERARRRRHVDLVRGSRDVEPLVRLHR